MLNRFSIALILCTGWMICATGSRVTSSFKSTQPKSIQRQASIGPNIIYDSQVSMAAYQQNVDHFSNDARAMSPRSWGNILAGPQSEPTAPQVTFDFGKPIQSREAVPEQVPELAPPSSPMRKVESSTVKKPQPFFEQSSLDPNTNALDASEYSSPLPMELANQETGDQLKNRLESNPAGSNAGGQSPVLTDQQLDQMPSTKDSVHERGFDSTIYGREVLSDSLPSCNSHLLQNDCDSCKQAGTSNCMDCLDPHRLTRRNHSMNSEELCSCGRDNCSLCLPVKYNQHLGHRYDYPVSRGTLDSSATKFSFEEDGEFPPASEILAQSIFWSEFDFMILQPSFQSNTAITSTGPMGSSQPFNFDLESSFRVAAGFESEYGPGFAFDYFQFDNNSDFANFTSDGATTGTTSVYQLGPNVWTDLIADDIGESLNAFHSLEVHSTSVYAFKAIKFKRAYVNGRFGLQIATVEQILRSRLLDAAGTEIGRLDHISNINAFGPRFGIDYVRKIGHTPAQLIASATTSLLFGDRDQFVENSTTGELSRIGADEFLSVFDIFFGVQGKRIRGEKRNNTFRVGFVNQTWFGGGTGIEPDGDFGFQGLSFMFGFNR